MSDKRFRIAFSFAGEKREFVAEVAAILAKQFGEDKILYDHYHKAEFAKARLGRSLPKLYHEESDLVVVVICRDYGQKEWPGLEWDAIFDLIKKRREEEVMLCNFDWATVDGLYSDAGFAELDNETPQTAAYLILERLAINEGLPKDHYTKPAKANPPVHKTAIPHNLPSLQTFFGRMEELRQIAEALDPEARTWGVLIDGPGGMGKTSLAVRAAYECTPAQFDRIIFLSVKDREMDDDGERKLVGFLLPGFLEMLNELARELGKPEINKSAEDHRVRLLHDALRDTRVLLILDNLESLTKDDRDQLLTFVKRLPSGCKAILTSRRRIGSGSELLILEKLDEAAALETLAELARHNNLLAKTSEAERAILYQQTGGKPLLLRWVAGQLGRGSCRTLANALKFLKSCPSDNDPLEFIFGDLAREFTEDETKVLCALSYFSLPAKVEHLAELAELENEATEIALRTLANRSLVIPDSEEIAFALLPMVADFLRRARPEAVAETGNRLEKRAYALIMENGYEQHDRFPTLDDAWPTVSPAIPLFVAGSNDRLVQICEALQDFLKFTGRWDDRLFLHLKAEEKSAAVGDYYNAGWQAYRAGTTYNRRRKADSVLACANRVKTHWQKATQVGVREESFAILLQGIGHWLKADYSIALNLFDKSLKLRRSLLADSEDVAIALAWLAKTELRCGDRTAAERDYLEALRVARSVDFDEGEATYLGHLADFALDRKDWSGAENIAREALSVAEKVRRQDLIAIDCQRIAKAVVRQGRSAEALPYAQRSVEIYERLGSPDLESARVTLRECES